MSVPTYRYFYIGNFTNISPRPWEGAYHNAELPMLFGTAGATSTAFENATSALMQDLWVTFATDPFSGLATQGWMPYMPRGHAAEFRLHGTLMQKIRIDALEAACTKNVA